MRIFLLFVIAILSSGCNTKYATKEGERLLGNTAAGCILGEVLFDNCGAGAAVGVGATIIDDQK